jgi:hypothetical protein
MTHRAILPALLLALLSPGCGGLDSDGPIEVRVRNETTVTFEEGILYLPGDSILFPGLAPGQATPYKEVEMAYRVATTQVVSGADTARLQVIDYVGDNRLRPGRYTFVLSFFEDRPTALVQGLEKDR